MKKSILLVFLVVAICFLLVGCKPKIPDIPLGPVEALIEPTAENPIIVANYDYDDGIDVMATKAKAVTVGYYHGYGQDEVLINITDCKEADTYNLIIDKHPELVSIKHAANQNKPIIYKIVIKEKGLTPGKYICNIVAQGKEIYESKEVILNVI